MSDAQTIVAVFYGMLWGAVFVCLVWILHTMTGGDDE